MSCPRISSNLVTNSLLGSVGKCTGFTRMRLLVSYIFKLGTTVKEKWEVGWENLIIYSRTNGEDAFPLIHLSPKKPSKMSRSPQQSTTIDKCINGEMHHVVAPDALLPDRPLQYLFRQDDVEFLHVKQKAPVEGLFEDGNEFRLTLRLPVPSSSGFLTLYTHSPIVVTDTFPGKEDDVHAPKCLQAHRLECNIWQACSPMLHLILYFVADLPENAQLCSKVNMSCKAIAAQEVLIRAFCQRVAESEEDLECTQFAYAETKVN
ncbi:hypothetical protein BDZ97DRAFT_1769481 [Flammula alnicola]|nr:hypothetical protein BDZ97DRAFT_1769481 [Flammula alnicola]